MWLLVCSHGQSFSLTSSWCVSVQIFTKGCVPLHPNYNIPFSPIIIYIYIIYVYIYISRIINSIYHPRHYPSILEYPIHIFNINIQQSDYEYPITYPVTSHYIISSYLIISHHISSYLIISHHISSYLIISHHISLYLIISHYISLYIIIYHYISLYLIIFEYLIMSHYVSIVSHCILSWLDIQLYHIYIYYSIYLINPHHISHGWFLIPWFPNTFSRWMRHQRQAGGGGSRPRCSICREACPEKRLQKGSFFMGKPWETNRILRYFMVFL